jgi:hypothetical protein
MNKHFIYITVLVVTVAFTFSGAVVGEGVDLTPDGRVPGKPFQDLQQQIDELRQQISTIQDSKVEAYVAKNGDIVMQPNSEADVMNMTLPMGAYINTITISAGNYPPTNNNTPISLLDCSFVDSQNIPITGDLVGGHVYSHESYAITLELQFWEQEMIDIKLRCHSMAIDESDIVILHAEWIAIKVDEIYM